MNEKFYTMDRYRTLKYIVYIIAVVMIAQLGMLIVMIKPSSFHLWAGFAVVAILCIYLVRVAAMLINELEEKDK